LIDARFLLEGESINIGSRISLPVHEVTVISKILSHDDPKEDVVVNSHEDISNVNRVKKKLSKIKWSLIR
jgi:hypothetical protein